MPTLDPPLFRLAHISDLHFSKLIWDPAQFLSKRWIGNLNLLLTRKHTFDPSGLTTLFPVFRDRKVDAVLITGDLTSTSHEHEFILAKEFIENLRKENFKVFTLPGNHDHYTKRAYRQKRFYKFFNATYSLPIDPLTSLNLKEDGVTATYFGHGWWVVGLDTALATSLLSSNGYFSEKLEQKLEEMLQQIPSDHQIILLNHFPLFSIESPRKSLVRKEALKKLIGRFSNVKLFLHGHTHRHSISDLRNSNLPIILDSGSAAQKHNGTWNLIDISQQGCNIEVFKNSQADRSWQPTEKIQFKW